MATLARSFVVACLLALPARSGQAEEGASFRDSALRRTSIAFYAGERKAALRMTGTVHQPHASAQVRLRRDERAGVGVNARFDGLNPALGFGNGYLTYVLWAIAPDGRAARLGEVRPTVEGRARLEARTKLDSFGLLLTAEPHFAVAWPGDLAVLLNERRAGPDGAEALLRPSESALPSPEERYRSFNAPWSGDYLFEEVPLDLKQARLALHRALAVNAGNYAPLALARAKARAGAAERAFAARDAEESATQARLSVRASEQARERALLAKEQARLAALREAADLIARSGRGEDRLRDAPSGGARGRLIVAEDIRFAPAGGRLAPGEPERLAALARQAAKDAAILVVVEGHTDSEGDFDRNLLLSGERARAVRAELMERGVPGERVEAYGLGETRPIADNATEEGRRHNRRVSVTLYRVR